MKKLNVFLYLILSHLLVFHFVSDFFYNEGLRGSKENNAKIMENYTKDLIVISNDFSTCLKENKALKKINNNVDSGCSEEIQICEDKLEEYFNQDNLHLEKVKSKEPTNYEVEDYNNVPENRFNPITQRYE